MRSGSRQRESARALLERELFKDKFYLRTRSRACYIPKPELEANQLTQGLGHMFTVHAIDLRMGAENLQHGGTAATYWPLNSDQIKE